MFKIFLKGVYIYIFRIGKMDIRTGIQIAIAKKKCDCKAATCGKMHNTTRYMVLMHKMLGFIDRMAMKQN